MVLKFLSSPFGFAPYTAPNGNHYNGARGTYDGPVPSTGRLTFEVIDGPTEKNANHPQGAFYPDNIGSYSIKIITTKVNNDFTNLLNNLINPMKYLIFGYCQTDDSVPQAASSLIKNANEIECASGTVSIPYKWDDGQCIAVDDPNTPLNERELAAIIETQTECESHAPIVVHGPTKWQPGMTKTMYSKVVTSSIFIDTVRASMILLLVIYGIMFMLGMISQAQETFIRTIIKISVISALISPASWNFFNNYLFALFIDGMNGLISILAGDFVGSGNSIDVRNPFGFIDKTMTKFFNANTFIKLIGLLFSSPIGFLYIAAMLAGMFFFLFAVVRRCLQYHYY